MFIGGASDTFTPSPIFFTFSKKLIVEKIECEGSTEKRLNVFSQLRGERFFKHRVPALEVPDRKVLLLYLTGFQN